MIIIVATDERVFLSQKNSRIEKENTHVCEERENSKMMRISGLSQNQGGAARSYAISYTRNCTMLLSYSWSFSPLSRFRVFFSNDPQVLFATLSLLELQLLLLDKIGNWL